LAFSGKGQWIGDLHQFGLTHIVQSATGFESLTIPPFIFCAFQMMFALFTPAVITGGVAERMKFGAWILFVPLWLILVYAPVAHWVFSPSGWLHKLGVEDFAGGTVVHVNAGAAALAMILVIGNRRGWPKAQMRPHNVPLVLLGASLLWFGWFGFTAGSAHAANNLATYAFINTNTAAGAALLAWLSTEKFRFGHATTLGAASGAVAGLVAITPAAGFISPIGALAIGLIAGVICCFATGWKDRLGYDDVVDVVGIHLVGGAIGALLVGVLGIRAIHGVNGLLYGGGWRLLAHQATAVLVVAAYSFMITYLLCLLLHKMIGLRADKSAEVHGLDLTHHRESAYEETIGAQLP
jgi:ammonium transporter, Amt family